MTIQANFSGSYLPSEVTLLLDIVSADSVNDISPTQKEALIQSGQRHYSDMLTLENRPAPRMKPCTIKHWRQASSAWQMMSQALPLAYISYFMLV